jgi:hypothetical protein
MLHPSKGMYSLFSKKKLNSLYPTVHFQTFFKKLKVIFLPVSIILRLIPNEILKKYKIEALYCACAEKFLPHAQHA